MSVCIRRILEDVDAIEDSPHSDHKVEEKDII